MKTFVGAIRTREWPREQANLHANKSFPLVYFLFFLGLRIEQYLNLQNL